MGEGEHTEEVIHDLATLRAAEKDSLVVKKSSKGEMTWEAKIYGNTTLLVVFGYMKARMIDLIKVAE